MKRYLILSAIAAGCATEAPKPVVEEVKYCAIVPTNDGPIQICALPGGILCFTRGSTGLSCVRPVFTTKA